MKTRIEYDEHWTCYYIYDNGKYLGVIMKWYFNATYSPRFTVCKCNSAKSQHFETMQDAFKYVKF